MDLTSQIKLDFPSMRLLLRIVIKCSRPMNRSNLYYTTTYNTDHQNRKGTTEMRLDYYLSVACHRNDCRTEKYIHFIFMCAA